MRELLLIDGDAVALVAWPTDSVKARRQHLVDHLASHQRETGVESDVVFDRYVGGAAETPAAGGIGVSLVGEPVEALKELAAVYVKEWSTEVVTSDLTLIQSLPKGAKVLSKDGLVRRVVLNKQASPPLLPPDGEDDVAIAAFASPATGTVSGSDRAGPGPAERQDRQTRRLRRLGLMLATVVVITGLAVAALTYLT